MTSRALLGALASAALALGLIIASCSTSLARLQTGVPAPDFTVTDSNGKEHSLAGYKGKTVVLEWTNHECPYTAKHYSTGNMQALQKEATQSGVVWLTIVSSKPGSQGHVTASEANALAAKQGTASSAILLDTRSAVGKLYGASTTPHMFIIDKDGKVVYMGAIDDRPTANRQDVKTARNHVREGLKALADGKPIEVSSTRPYGCSIKY